MHKTPTASLASQSCIKPPSWTATGLEANYRIVILTRQCKQHDFQNQFVIPTLTSHFPSVEWTHAQSKPANWHSLSSSRVLKVAIELGQFVATYNLQEFFQPYIQKWHGVKMCPAVTSKLQNWHIQLYAVQNTVNLPQNVRLVEWLVASFLGNMFQCEGKPNHINLYKH